MTIVGDSSAGYFKAIAESKNQTYARILYGLGIRHVGNVNAKILTARFSTIEDLSQTSFESIEAVYGIGEEIAQSVFEWMRVPDNQALVQKLQENGLKFIDQSANEQNNVAKTEKIFTGKTFVITGTLPSLKREQAKEIIEQAGGKVTVSISKKTDYLLLGENAGSKLAKAEKIGIKQISEAKLFELLK